jgi:F-type H+-transporting ATPase subunit b
VKSRILVFAVLGAALLAAPAGAADPPAHSPAAGTHAAADEHKSDIFAGGLGNMIWTTIIFAIVVVILGKKAWPQILRTLNEREASIRGALEHAQREREAAEKLLADYKRQIDHARQEATAIVEEGRRDGEEVRRRLAEEARRESAETLARAKREIQLAADAAVKELHDQTSELAVQLAGGIIRKELRADDHRALLTESLARMSASKN